MRETPEVVETRDQDQDLKERVAQDLKKENLEKRH